MARIASWMSRRVGWIVAAAAMALSVPSWAGAADVEMRDFTIQVDGKQAGEYHMTITRQDDGTVTMAAQSNVTVKVLLVPVYSYAYSGEEVWKGGRLQHFTARGKEKSKEFAVAAGLAADGMHVNANGQEHITRPDIWTTSCWQLPDASLRNQDVPLMECDSGKDIAGHLQFIATERTIVAGQEQTCAHYQVINIVPHEAWYDAEDRLVRMEWESDGHRSVIELTSVRH